MKILIIYFISAILAASALSLQAGTLPVPTSFTAGTPALAAEVNGNFTAVKTAVDDNDARIAVLEAALATLQTTVTSQATTITTLEGDLTTANTNIATLQTDLAGKAAITHNHDAAYSAIGHTHAQSDITGLVSDLGIHTSQISAINNSSVMDLNPFLTVTPVTGGVEARLSAVNLQIVNGLGTTDTINGLGNLIIGYDEVNTSFSVLNCSDGAFTNQTTCEGAGQTWSNSHKTGSHYIVLGTRNSYSQFGGIVAGEGNFATRAFSTVTGGAFNTASGFHSSVSGGDTNNAIGSTSSVSGGFFNTASVNRSSVSGGGGNIASGSFSSVSGGRNNTASGLASSVSGGNGRSVTGSDDWRAGTLFEDF